MRSTRGVIMFSRKINKLYITFFIFIAVMVIFLGKKYEFHITNLYEYTFHRAPYINRVFYTKLRVINPKNSKDDLYKKLIMDKNYEDRRWGTANFKRPFEHQISINYAPTGMQNYISFIKEFSDKFSIRKGELSDQVAEKIKKFVYYNWLKGQKSPEFEPDEVIEEIMNKSEKDRNPEDLIYWFVNYKCACGTISETSVALLRELGFRTRLLRMSKERNKQIANHVFLEYYSKDSKKWVMFDAMENLIPQRDGKLLSALEFFLNPKDEDNYKRTKDLYPHANPGSSIWFQINGPIKTLFFLTIQ